MEPNNDKAFVSVIIPCFRCSNTIERAFASILAQTKIPKEVILVDDFSCDGTLDILRNIFIKYPDFVKLIELNRNVGAASARNMGWSVSRQPYIAFLDADDSWHKDKIKIQYEYMVNNPTVSLSGHQCNYKTERKNIIENLNQLNVTIINAKSLLFKNPFSTPTVMLKRDIPFQFVEGLRFAEDLRLWQTIGFNGLVISRIEKNLAYVHKPLYGYAGLSAQLEKMEKFELLNLITMYKMRYIKISLLLVSIAFSILKYVKRFFIVLIIKLTSN